MNINSNAGAMPVNTNMEPSRSETIYQLARRHMKDRNHTTTDEELRNAKIELSNIESLNTKEFYTKKVAESINYRS